jgi:hypothetical protein
MYEAVELVLGGIHVFVSVEMIFILENRRKVTLYSEWSHEFLFLLYTESNQLWPCVLGFFTCKWARNFCLGPTESDTYSWLRSCGIKHEIDHPLRCTMAGILPPNYLYDFMPLFLVKATTFSLLLIIIVMFTITTIGGVIEPPGYCTVMLLLVPPPPSPPSASPLLLS